MENWKPLRLKPPKLFDEKSFFSKLSACNQVRRDHSRSAKQIYFDTFDWRLYNQKLALFRSGNQVILRNLNDRIPFHRLCINSQPVFIWDFPESPLKEQVKSVLGPRALLSIFEINNRQTAIRILDNLEKTVVRLYIEKIALLGNRVHVPLGIYISVYPVKGYDKICLKLIDWLTKNEFNTCKNDVYHHALSALKKSPGDYSTKPNITLSPGMRSDIATQLILRFLLNVIKRNEDGVRKDIDTEFLHDFRVAIRRTRSALSQIKDVFPSKIAEHFKKHFSDLGKKTNQLRDLDVYLLRKEEYKNMLPDVFRDDIELVFKYLEKERRKNIRQVVRVLDSDRYKQILQEWEKFLSVPTEGKDFAKNAEKPIAHLACQRIYRKYRAVMKLGKSIHEKSKDERLHRLRIECKKLRYLLEFFSSLFPDNELKNLVKHLKKLQDNLGRFQDLCVHELSLQDFVVKLPCHTVQTKQTIMAIGTLANQLHLERQKVRMLFVDVFSEFSSSKNKTLFHKLFAKPVTEDLQ